MIQSFFHLFIAFGKKINEDNINAHSAHAAFFIIISFFPFVMFLLTLLSYFPFFSQGLPALGLDFIPTTVSTLIQHALTEMSNRATTTLLSVTVIVSVWSASRATLSIMRGLNNIYNIRETRKYYITRILATLYTVAFAVLLLIMMIIFVFGNQLTLWLATRFPVLGDFAMLIISVRTATGIGVLIFFFLLIYIQLPNRKSGLLRELPGAILTAAGWVGFSFLFSYYVDHLSNYTAIYGSLTTLVLSMLWLYACMYILFFGAELNATLRNPTVRRSLRHLLKWRRSDVPTEEKEHQ